MHLYFYPYSHFFCRLILHSIPSSINHSFSFVILGQVYWFRSVGFVEYSLISVPFKVGVVLWNFFRSSVVCSSVINNVHPYKNGPWDSNKPEVTLA